MSPQPSPRTCGPVPLNVALDTGGAAVPERLSGHLVSLEYFSTLGVEPLIGRFFNPDFERLGAAPTAVVSERFWRTRLNADPSAVGRVLWINGRRAAVVGIAPTDFLGVFPLNPVDIFVPVTADAAVAPELADGVLDNPASQTFRIVLRLAPNATMTAAAAALDVRTRQLDETYGTGEPDTESPSPRVRLVAAGGVAAFPAELRSLVVVFMATVTTVILTFTCANLAGLLLARASARRREMAIRCALGASRIRLVRQLLAESILTAIAGGAGGLAATYGFIELLTRTVSSSPLFPLAVGLTPRPRVAAVTFCSALLAGVGVGFLPALAATRTDLVGGLKAHVGAALTGYRRFGLRNLFVVYQVTAAMALVVMMGFMIAGIQRGAGRDPGFDATGLSMISVDPVRDGYSPNQAARLIASLPEQLVEQKNVEAVALMDPRVFQLFALPDTNVSVPSDRSASQGSIQRVTIQTVGPGFFAALGVPVLRGSEFSDRDFRGNAAPDTAVATVINHTAAAELFGDSDPLGRFIRLDEKVLRVTGVVGYGLAPPFRTKPSPIVALPLTVQDLWRTRPQGVALLVRAREETGLEQTRSALYAIDPRLTMFNARTIGDQLDDLYALVGYNTAIYGIVGVFALVLASVGLAGVTAHAAMRRRKEIGIRMALGAQSLQVLGLIMREGATMATVGAFLGIVAASAGARALMAFDSQLAQSISLGAGSSLQLAAGPVLLIAVTTIACYLPVRRSATLDPLVTLREE